MTRLPTVFLSHGSPMLALDEGAVRLAWRRLAQGLPRPRAVVVVSAHWSAPQAALGAAARPHTIHDFYGFPAALYALRYEPPGAPELAQALADGLDEAGLPARLDCERGLDHGAWIPLRDMYPQADVPVVPLALDGGRSPAWHYRLGQLLAPLLDENVLLLASGSLTHNLRDWSPSAGTAAPYVRAFQTWFAEHLAAGDTEALLDYRRRAPEAARAHPTEEHLLPLFVALGAAAPGARAQRRLELVSDHALAMDAYTFAA